LAIERVKAPEELPNGQPLRLTRGGRQAVGTGIIPLPPVFPVRLSADIHRLPEMPRALCLDRSNPE
jgi:hypothetical protein